MPPTLVGFDGVTASVTNQAAGTWHYFQVNQSVLAGGNYSQTNSVTLPVSYGGSYNYTLFVQVDIYDYIYESNKSNNISAPIPGTVTSPPVFQTVNRPGNVIAFAWSAVMGQTYQLEYKTNLTQASWINLGSPVTATNGTVTRTDVIGDDPQRFYRVELLL
ncbi:MAG: hypothetical protein DME23_05595 [Verrucomicrobia bacterium]|nr:MAG: hypothetical protein DME23_05595 [Verrucomicrobiota bacterium]